MANLDDSPSEEVMSAAKGILWCCGISAVVVVGVITWAIFF